MSNKSNVPTLNRIGLVEAVANSTKDIKDSKLSKQDSLKVVNTFLDIVSETLVDINKSVKFVGFGTLSTYMSKETTKVNIETKVKFTVSPKRRVRFSTSQNLKDGIQHLITSDLVETVDEDEDTSTDTTTSTLVEAAETI